MNNLLSPQAKKSLAESIAWLQQQVQQKEDLIRSMEGRIQEEKEAIQEMQRQLRGEDIPGATYQGED